MAVEQHASLSPELRAELRDYLARAGASRGACGEMDPAWLDVLQDGLGHRPLALVHRDRGGAIDGYLPMAWVRSRLFGRFLVSLPYLNRAGVVTEHDGVADALIATACEAGRRGGARYVELRHDARRLAHDLLHETRDDKSRMVLALAADGEALWTGLNAKVRNQVRKGQKANLEIRWGGRELARAFHDVFAVTMRDLGTPVYARRLFEAVLTHLDGRAELAVVQHDGRPVAGALLIHETTGGEPITQVPSAACLRSANPLCANMFLYHALLERAIARGSASFDFGRSSEGSGTWKFKKQWGAQPVPSPWQYCRLRGATDAVRPDNPRYARRIEMWRKLPLWATRMAGPAIVRGIP